MVRTYNGEMFVIPKEFEEEIRADERAKCETCIHKVTKEDIDAIEETARADEREKVLDEELQNFAQWLWDSHYLVNEAFTIRLVEQYKMEQLKEQKNEIKEQ